MSAYEHFDLAIYCTAGCLANASEQQLEEELAFFRKHFKINKLYIENHRGEHTVPAAKLNELKQFYSARGIKTAGGITPTIGASYRGESPRLFGVICYTDEASREKFQSVVEDAASVFDEIIFDDFFFTNCGCETCIERKGEMSWREFRLKLMADVSENLIRIPAKRINPNVKLVIKYPNWVDSYQATGYNTAMQPSIFDGVYTGTETRSTAYTQQHLPRYASYSLLRWFDEVAPGRNGGGWFDNLDCETIDEYLEQANLTVFGKAREITLFCYSLLKNTIYVPSLGFQLDKLDRLASKLGEPITIPYYLPHRAIGEYHLYDYLGWAGFAVSPTPHFPIDGGNVVLSRHAAADPDILEKMDGHLKRGGNLFITSELVEALADRGIEQFTTMRSTGKKAAFSRFAVQTDSCGYRFYEDSQHTVTFPLFEYQINATWQVAVGMNGDGHAPLVMQDHYGKGKVFTLVLPDHSSELFALPSRVLSVIRALMSTGLPCHAEGPAGLGLFLYDNGTVIAESFLPHNETWQLRIKPGYRALDLESGTSDHELFLRPHQLRAFILVPER